MNVELIVTNISPTITIDSNGSNTVLEITNVSNTTLELIDLSINPTIEVIDSNVGIKGDSGLSAYEVDVQLNGFTGTESEWIEYIRTIDWSSTNW